VVVAEAAAVAMQAELTAERAAAGTAAAASQAASTGGAAEAAGAGVGGGEELAALRGQLAVGTTIYIPRHATSSTTL
jgi:hypothetical protein